MSMNLDEAIAALQRMRQSVPIPTRLPTEAEVAAVERDLGVTLHPDLRRYLLEASDVTFGIYEPATITAPGAHTDLAAIIADARTWGVPTELLPFCQANSNFYCLAEGGSVAYWAHDGGLQKRETWPSLAAWIESVWLGES